MPLKESARQIQTLITFVVFQQQTCSGFSFFTDIEILATLGNIYVKLTGRLRRLKSDTFY